MSSGAKVLRGRWQARAPRVSYCSKRRTERSHVRGALGGAHGEAQLPHRTVVAQQPREDEQGAWLEGALPARVRLVGSCRVLIRPTSSVILSEVSASCCAPAGSVSSSSTERRQFALTCCSLHFSTERRHVDGQVPAGGETGESSIT